MPTNDTAPSTRKKTQEFLLTGRTPEAVIVLQIHRPQKSIPPMEARPQLHSRHENLEDIEGY